MAAVTLALILLLVASAAHKFIQRDSMAPVTARLVGVPAAAGALVLLLAASAEILAALALVMPATRLGGAMAAAAIWTSYAVALLRHRGSVLDCGCDLVRREKPVGLFAILRPVLLAAAALSVALVPPRGWTVDAPFAAAALLALWFAASELAAIPAFSRSAKGMKS
ncbi:MAG: hypothetical protein IE933_00500 [Sphingomonadales bacterium]|nr:hypothetical protein [Sphingomonadales bacterium]MBD3772584.1 hypothetical protein [Paracoccaceae bacterium]